MKRTITSDGVGLLTALSILTERQVNFKRPDLREDLIQTGLESGIRSLSTYRTRRGYTKKSWIIMHMRRDMIRFIENEAQYQGMIDIDTLSDCEDVEQLLDTESEAQVQNEADAESLLSMLPKDEAQAVFLHYYEDLSYSLIAERMSLSKQAVYRLIRDGERSLRLKYVLRN